MQSLHLAMSKAALAARRIVAPKHIAGVEAALISSLEEFSLASDEQFEHIANGPGVYLFDIRFSFRTEKELIQFAKDWGSKGGLDLQKGTSRSYPKRAKQHIGKVEAGEFVPFYLGKRMAIRDRVRNHLTGKSEAGTYGLKLLSRTELLKNCTLRAGGVTFELPTEAYFCIQFIEAELRKQLHPIIGKQ
jgi:hypothetical protein